MNEHEFKAGDTVRYDYPNGSFVVGKLTDYDDSELYLAGFPGLPYAKTAHNLGITVHLVKAAEPELPTEPGTYEAKKFPLDEGSFPYVLDHSGWSVDGTSYSRKAVEDALSEGFYKLKLMRVDDE